MTAPPEKYVSTEVTYRTARKGQISATGEDRRCEHLPDRTARKPVREAAE